MTKHDDPLRRLLTPDSPEGAESTEKAASAPSYADISAIPVRRHQRKAAGLLHERHTDGRHLPTAPTGVADSSSSAREQLDSQPRGVERRDLNQLSEVIDEAVKFAAKWEEPYRVAIFKLAVQKLMEFQGRASSQKPADVGHATTRPIEDLGPANKLATELGMPLSAIERLVSITQDGEVSILARLPGDSKKELQFKYSICYLYIKEMALTVRLVDVDELRSICIREACYDSANFATYLKKAVLDGFLREQSDNQGRNRKYMLSPKGIREAAALLKGLAQE